jgi:hypothetical protein
MPKKYFEPTRSKLAAFALAAASLLSSCGNRVNPAPKPSPPPPFEFLGSWGIKGNGPGQLDTPVSFSADSLGNVFFADPGAGFVHKFESNGTPLLSFQEATVRRAAGIAVDTGGAIYVANAQQGSIFIYFPDGAFFQTWRAAPQRHFSGALGFGIDEMGDVFLPDPAKSRVLKLSNRGRLLKTWPAPGKAASPDERPALISAEPDNFIFVAYASTGRVEKFSSDGSSTASWVASGAPTGETAGSGSNSITGLAAAGDFVFTMAASSSQIRVWTIDGQHKLDVDLGANIGDIAAPQIAVTPRSELLVFDPAAPKIYRFRTHLTSQGPP